MLSKEYVSGSINTPDRQLLYDIRELLKEQNELLKQMLPKKEELKQEPKLCQYCGGTHDNVGQRLACAKKNKKKEEPQND